MRSAISTRKWRKRLRFVSFMAAIVAIVFLFGSIHLRAYAATPAHGRALPTPPPVPGTLTVPSPTAGVVLINEALNNPASTWNCAEQGTFSTMSDSWVEVYNPQSEALNLYAAHAYLDTGPNSYRFYLPFGSAIAPHGFLVVFPNGSSGTLLAGNNLRLMMLDTTIDQLSIPGLSLDSSYARIPDGSSDWRITTAPTIDASNLAAIPTTTPTTTSLTPTSTSTKTASSGPGGNGDTPTTSTPVVVSGTQPTWNTLHLPPVTQINPTPQGTTTTLLPSSPSSATNSPISDVPRRIILTALLLALAAALFWCWKAYASQ